MLVLRHSWPSLRGEELLGALNHCSVCGEFVKRAPIAALAFLGLISVLLTCSCGGGPPISVSVSPASAQTDQGQTLDIAATVANDSSNQGVRWSLTGPGSITPVSPAEAVYTAPAPSNIPTVQNATVIATSATNQTKTASAQIQVNPLPQILPVSFPNGTTGVPYSQSVGESGGTPPFNWSVGVGAVPLGLSIDSNTATVSGTPTGGGTWYFDLKLTDAAGASVEAFFSSLTIISTLPSKNPVPFLNQPLIPDTISQGGPAFTLTVNGTGFVSGANVEFNSTTLATTFISSSRLTATVPATAIASAGTAAITVVNPAPSGPASNVVYFTVAIPEAALNFSNATGSPIRLPFAFGPGTLAIGDFSGNGKVDLATNYASNAVNVLLGNGDGTFTQATGSPITIPNPPWDTATNVILSSLGVGDFDNSGHLGLVATDVDTENVDVLLGNGNGTFVHSTAFVASGPDPNSLAVGDWNGDGNLDVAVAPFFGSSGTTIELGYSDGAFNTPNAETITPVINGAQTAIAAGDFNGDGKIDLAVTSEINTLTILLGNGDGTFSQATGSPVTVGNYPVAIVICDFNGDGKLDLAIANSQDNTVTILLGNGNGTFTQAPGSPITVGSTPQAIAVGDFTGNGKPGLAVANAGSNNVTILSGNGDGTFAPAPGSPVATGADPDLLAAGDFNGSGRLGLAVGNSGDHTISILVQH